VYPLTEGLQDRFVRSLIYQQIATDHFSIQDPLPVSLRNSQHLMDFTTAVKEFHFPKSWTERDKARERLAFDEFFLLELALAINRQDREKNNKGFVSVLKKHLLTPFKNSLRLRMDIK
jgi:ATP-dependent DNA helicase RecG